MSNLKITKADVQAAEKPSKKATIKKVNRKIFVEVEPGMTWADLSYEQRQQVLFQHENHWRSMSNKQGQAMKADHKLTRG